MCVCVWGGGGEGEQTMMPLFCVLFVLFVVSNKGKQITATEKVLEWQVIQSMQVLEQFNSIRHRKKEKRKRKKKKKKSPSARNHADSF